MTKMTRIKLGRRTARGKNEDKETQKNFAANATKNAYCRVRACPAHSADNGFT